MAVRFQAGRAVPVPGDKSDLTDPVKKAAYDIVSAGEQDAVYAVGRAFRMLRGLLRKNSVAFPVAGYEMEMDQAASKIKSSPVAKAQVMKWSDELSKMSLEINDMARQYDKKVADFLAKWETMEEAVRLRSGPRSM